MPTVSIKEQLAAGLRPDQYVGLNAKFMQECSSMRLSPFGLLPMEPVNFAMETAFLSALGVTVSHPFPQLFKGKGVTLLADEDKVYLVDESTWIATEITTYDVYDPATPKSITAGGAWQFVDFHTTWFLFNGNCQVFPTKWLHDTKVFVQEDVTMSTGCDYKGRMLAGGFNSDDIWSKGLYQLNVENLNNGAFATDATVEWTLGANWAWNSGGYIEHSAGAAANAYQDDEDMDVRMRSGVEYTVVFTVDNMTAGDVRVFVGGTIGTTRIVDGTYTQVLTASTAGTVILLPSTDFDGRITNISLKATTTPKAIEYGFTQGAPNTNWIWWSQIGGGDLMQFFLPETVTLGIDEAPSISGVGGYDESNPLYLAHARRVSAGFMPMDWQGAVQNIRPMEDVVMVYGEDGISAVRAFQEPVPTFGLMENLLRVGIASRNAVGGDQKQQVFLDASGVLWMVSGDLSLKRLGYREYFAQMLGNEITISYEPGQRVFYISDTNISFVLNEFGLTEWPQRLTSVFQIDGDAAGIFEDNLGEENVTNGGFVNGSSWDLGTGWSIGAGVATKTAGSASDLEQSADNVAIDIEEGERYLTQFAITVSAGSVKMDVGGTNGLTRVSSNTYVDEIVAGSDGKISVEASATFIGTVDSVSVKKVSPIYEFTFTSQKFGILDRRVKTLKEVIVIGVDDDESLEIQIQYKNSNLTTDWVETLWNAFDSPGRIQLNIPATEFRIKLRGNDARNIAINDIEIVLSETGKKDTRRSIHDAS